jgi:hypothetical protein
MRPISFDKRIVDHVQRRKSAPMCSPMCAAGAQCGGREMHCRSPEALQCMEQASHGACVKMEERARNTKCHRCPKFGLRNSQPA